MVLLGFTEFYLVLLSFTEFYWVLLGFTGLVDVRLAGASSFSFRVDFTEFLFPLYLFQVYGQVLAADETVPGQGHVVAEVDVLHGTRQGVHLTEQFGRATCFASCSKTRYYWVLLGFTGFYWDTIYSELACTTRLYLVVPSFKKLFPFK